MFHLVAERETERRQKAKGKKQKAKISEQPESGSWTFRTFTFCLLPFAFCLFQCFFLRRHYPHQVQGVSFVGLSAAPAWRSSPETQL
jgi:hypothetical protein